MRITVLAFATAAQALGGRELELELPDGSRLADLHRSLVEDCPALSPLWPRMAIAVNGVLAQPDSPIPPNAEVALLPPVSGGNSSRTPRARIVDGPIDVQSVLSQVNAASCGAVVTFIGTVRDHHHGLQVSKIFYDAYRPMALATLQSIAGDLVERSSATRIGIVHRLGEVPAGDISIVIAAASPHRAAAYEASREALERIKREVPIWKEEYYADGSKKWREEEVLKVERRHSASRS